jgi:tRNA1Val (adenine37-N6)-methyltransferase
MPNSFFQFKQFRIEQGWSAMKVTTEACVFGALVAKTEIEPNRILDIGTGTGLLSLMLAQAYKGSIDAVEIDAAAANQAEENFALSPWSERLQLIHSDVIEYAESKKKVYDLIISNPPFFSNHLKSGIQQRDQAIHVNSLTQARLIEAANSLISKHGILAVIYPTYEADQFAELALKCGLYLQEEIILSDRAGKKPLRKILLFNVSNKAETLQSEFVIKDEDGQYSRQMKSLLRDYYLNF